MNDVVGIEDEKTRQSRSRRGRDGALYKRSDNTGADRKSSERFVTEISIKNGNNNNKKNQRLILFLDATLLIKLIVQDRVRDWITIRKAKRKKKNGSMPV